MQNPKAGALFRGQFLRVALVREVRMVCAVRVVGLADSLSLRHTMRIMYLLALRECYIGNGIMDNTYSSLSQL